MVRPRAQPGWSSTGTGASALFCPRLGCAAMAGRIRSDIRYKWLGSLSRIASDVGITLFRRMWIVVIEAFHSRRDVTPGSWCRRNRHLDTPLREFNRVAGLE